VYFECVWLLYRRFFDCFSVICNKTFYKVYTLFSHTHLTTLSQLLAVGGVTPEIIYGLCNLCYKRHRLPIIPCVAWPTDIKGTGWQYWLISLLASVTNYWALISLRQIRLSVLCVICARTLDFITNLFMSPESPWTSCEKNITNISATVILRH